MLLINLGTLVRNWLFLRDALASGCECAAVVKADAYGLGLTPVTRALIDAGCETFFVASIEEAETARRLSPTITIYVLGGLDPEKIERFAAVNAGPVLGAPQEIDLFRARRAAGAFPHAAIHIDTGMNRHGLSYATALETDIATLSPTLILSHLTSASDPTSKASHLQLDRFAALRSHLSTSRLSLANSSGIFLGAAYHFSLARPGYALYGGNPTPILPNPMAPVVTLSAPIRALRTLEKGETVGYDRKWIAQRRTRVALIALGYAEGYPRSAVHEHETQDVASQAYVRLGNAFCPIIGLISMDWITIDVTDASQDDVFYGANVFLIDDTLTIDRLAKVSQTIGYEILTRLGQHIERRYVS